MAASLALNSHRKLVLALRILLVMIVGLMALGAGVRAMNAGLSCPDWPLCFGKVIPDFHPAVWFEFVHRAYAGIVAILFFGVSLVIWTSKTVGASAKRAAALGFIFLFLQIAAGALTVLWGVKWATVTSHLMLATLFFVCVLWMLYAIRPSVQEAKASAPSWVKFAAGFLSIAVFTQIFLGGVVASTFAGSVCVDWPLCNGQWVPTWQGAIGHQIIHRFVAYALAIALLAFTIVLNAKKNAAWMTPQLLRLSRWSALVVFLQVGVGVANLMLFIPAWLTVAHQSVAILLLAINIRVFLVARGLATAPTRAMAHESGVPLTGAQTFGGVSG